MWYMHVYTVQYAVEPHLTVTSVKWAPSVYRSAGKLPNNLPLRYIHVHFHTPLTVTLYWLFHGVPTGFSIPKLDSQQRSVLAQEMTMTHPASQVGIVGAYSVHPSFH